MNVNRIKSIYFFKAILHHMDIGIEEGRRRNG